jgi:hypothetical protein
VDINGDGNIDLLGESYAGLTYILYGNNDGSLKEAIVLKDKSGTDIRLDTYYNFKKDEYITLGKKENAVKADFVKAHDWDNDGDLDLFISGKNGGIMLRINEGTRTNPVFGTKNIKIVPEHFADALVDWDGDGLWDIVGGSQNGGVYFYKNTGKLGAPAFGKAECIIDPLEIVNKINSDIMEITQIAVADYNNDGKLDILIGSRARVKNPKSTSEEIEKLQEKSNKLEDKLNETINKLQDYTYNAYILLKSRNSTTTE